MDFSAFGLLWHMCINPATYCIKSCDFVHNRLPGVLFSSPYFSMADLALVPQTPPRKVMKPRRVADLTGLWEAWEGGSKATKALQEEGKLVGVGASFEGWAHQSEVFDAQLEGAHAFA